MRSAESGLQAAGVRVTACLAFMALVSFGCAKKEERVPVFPARGSVYADGKPAERALVIFHPLGGKDDPTVPRATGEVQADGTFAVGTYSADDGAPAGEYAVTISWPSGSGSPYGGDADSGPDRLGGRYMNPKTTILRARVNAAATEIPAFKLKS